MRRGRRNNNRVGQHCIAQPLLEKHYSLVLEFLKSMFTDINNMNILILDFFNSFAYCLIIQCNSKDNLIITAHSHYFCEQAYHIVSNNTMLTRLVK